MKIQRLSASTFKFYSPSGKVVVIDPWLTNDPLWPLSERSPDKLTEIDIIAITHAHFDHAAGLAEIAQHKNNVAVIAQFEYALSLRQRGITNVIPTSFGATVDLERIKFSLVPASHTNSEMLPDGKIGMVGSAAGYVIEFEHGLKIYVSGDTGLTADMKFVVGDYHKPDVSILPVIGFLMMEPEQAAYAAHVTGCRLVIPSHDFPRNVSDAADPAAYGEFLKQFPVQDTYKKVDAFMEIMARQYPHIEVTRIDIGGNAEI